MNDTTWFKSSRSGSNGNCVEVALPPGVALVRDSKEPARGHLTVPANRWRGFLTSLKSGHYDG